MEHRVRINWVGAAAVIAAAVVLSVTASAVMVSKAYVKRGEVAARGPQEITVKGYARTRVRSDLAQWTILVRGRGDDLASAFGQLESGAGRVRAFLSSRGFLNDAVSLAAIETTTHYELDDRGRSTSQIVGYTLSQSISVRSNEVDAIASAAAKVTDLLEEGISVVSYAPEYYFTGIEDLKIALAGDAAANARQRADAIATESGSRVATVSSAHMGVIQITRPNSTEVSSYGIYDTGTIDKDVSVVVTLTLALEAAG